MNPFETDNRPMPAKEETVTNRAMREVGDICQHALKNGKQAEEEAQMYRELSDDYSRAAKVWFSLAGAVEEAK